MVIHKRKFNNDRLKLSLKAHYSVLLPGPSMSTSTATASTTTGGIIPEAIEDDSLGVVRVEDDSAKLEDEVERVRRRTEKRKRIYQTADAVIETLEHLSERPSYQVHEVARAASIVVSAIYRIIKAKHEQNEAIVALYDIMIETHKIAVEKGALNQESEFTGLFDEIVQQTEECYVFLSNYMYKGRLYQVMDFWNSPSKIEDFKSAFEQLKMRFMETQVEVTTATVLYTQRVVLHTQRVVESIDQKMKLRPLEPSTELGPKCHCLLGTRRASLTKILDWCFYGDQSTLWISGIAGCGKSSLIGTLHNSLTTLGFHSRLAAFIRFDRSSYGNAKEFVKALAFSLANFDERFGKQIVEVVEKSPQIAQNTDLSTQVQKLLINPLRGLSEEIAKEGRIVVLVDGIDECSREDRAETNFREQLLELFADDKFGLLPFLRFVLASRPEEDIVTYLRNLNHIHHFQLDHTSNETREDIHYFLTISIEKRPPFRVLDPTSKRSAIKLLADRASGLFVWAATVVVFIAENVVKRLDLFTQEEPSKDPLHALTILYETALNSLVNSHGDDDIKENICIALGLIIASGAFPSVQVLHSILNIPYPKKQAGILGAFQKLQSLVIVTQENGAYQLLHKSFDDFLTSKDRAGHWYIDMEKYRAILYEAMITCTMDHLDKADEELPEALSSDLYLYAIEGPVFGVQQNLSLYQSLQQKLKRFLLGYVKGGSTTQKIFGIRCHQQAEKLQHDSEFMRKAWLGASGLEYIAKHPLVVKDFFNIMLYDAALAGKVTKTNPKDQPESLEWEVDNIYMSVFIQMASGSNVYEEIVVVLDKNPIPPVVSLGPEMEMPIKIREASVKEFIEWGEYKEGKWVPIVEPQNRGRWRNVER
ncbi:hypothetical protein VNI00_013054 [Paramarasmius palmivorus]|uniref:NACHT domain-containing protein n=1 Tax=Paramarasmius palmivorus TaxID=297713 RepID=A0AAW0BZB3_9AGAR